MGQGREPSALVLPLLALRTERRMEGPRAEVTQISNLPYRRAPILQLLQPTDSPRRYLRLPIGNRRYSRLEICATAKATRSRRRYSAIFCSTRPVRTKKCGITKSV